MAAPRTRVDVEQTIWRKATADDGAEAIWHILTWDVSKVVLPVARVRDLLDACDLKGIASPPIQKQGALLRALKEMAEDETVKEIRGEDGKADPDETVWALLRITGDVEARQAQVKQRLYAVYHKRGPNAGTVEYSSAEARAAIEPLLHLYSVSYTARDIVDKVLAYGIRQAGGLQMRKQGGMYVVPPQGGITVERLRTFVEMVAVEASEGEAHLTDIQATDSGRTRNDMRYHSHKALVSEIASLRSKLKDMLRTDGSRTDEEGKSKVKSETVAGYLQACNDLGERAALWRDAAELGLRELNPALNELREAFKAVRTGLTIDEFDATLARVNGALAAAANAKPHAAETPDDDPFAPEPDEEAPAPVAVPAGAIAEQPATATASAGEEQGDPFAGDPFDD